MNSLEKAVAWVVLLGFWLFFCAGCGFLAACVYVAMEQGWGL